MYLLFCFYQLLWSIAWAQTETNTSGRAALRILIRFSSGIKPALPATHTSGDIFMVEGDSLQYLRRVGRRRSVVTIQDRWPGWMKELCDLIQNRRGKSPAFFQPFNSPRISADFLSFSLFFHPVSFGKPDERLTRSWRGWWRSPPLCL